ncbi:MAG: hypothetical protein JWP12_1598 [Bacteroidetes bacterium]|nr:hypothetical protein [Bacteroidota bacterium]
MKKTIAYSLIILAFHSSCNGNQGTNTNAAEPTVEVIKADSIVSGTIKNMWCGSYQGSSDAGIILDNGKRLNFAFCQGSSDIPGHIMVKGDLVMNAETKDVLLKEKDQYVANPKYLGRKVNMTYSMNGAERVVSKIELVGDANSETSQVKEYNGMLIKMSRKKDERGYFLDIKKEDETTETLRLFDDGKGYSTVATIFSGDGGPKKSQCVFIFGSGYILNLIPDNIERAAKITIEPKVIDSSNKASMAFLSTEPVITKIEWLK